MAAPDIVDRLRAAGCVFAEAEAAELEAAASGPEELAAMVARRAAGEPLEQVIGWVEFAGIRILLEPGVFVPRARTEFLVERAAEVVRPGAVVVDLCCGSGAVGAALGSVELHAVDLDPVAVRCARRNLPSAAVYEGDLFEPLPASLRGRVDVLVANVPYVPSGEIALMPPEARDHEPRLSLDGGADGLEIARRVATSAPAWLVPGGQLLIEASEDQAPTASAEFERAGLTPRVAVSEELEVAVVIGSKPV